jgi:hypothetical protein
MNMVSIESVFDEVMGDELLNNKQAAEHEFLIGMYQNCGELRSTLIETLDALMHLVEALAVLDSGKANIEVG